jgi:hypothetical protein
MSIILNRGPLSAIANSGTKTHKRYFGGTCMACSRTVLERTTPQMRSSLTLSLGDSGTRMLNGWISSR